VLESLEDGWREIIDGYLDRILDAGFDGVYLDIIDAYEFFGLEGEMPERDDAAIEMLRLVGHIAARARAERPGFLVFPQNGPGILDVLTNIGRALYLQTVDGIGAEDSFYFGDDDEDNPLTVQSDAVRLLREFRDAGRLVLAVDYLTEGAKVADFCVRARAEGFVPTVTVRALDRMPAACPSG
jgi:cysteinyl-tRNA synthetase